jgi:hypothetical protein
VSTGVTAIAEVREIAEVRGQIAEVNPNLFNLTSDL